MSVEGDELGLILQLFVFAEWLYIPGRTQISGNLPTEIARLTGLGKLLGSDDDVFSSQNEVGTHRCYEKSVLSLMGRHFPGRFQVSWGYAHL